MRGILIAMLALAVAATPVIAGTHLLGPPVITEKDDDCGEHGQHGDDGASGPGTLGGDHQHDHDDDDDCPPAVGAGRFIVQSEILNGLGAGALYPFIDTTPHNITSAHIAITDGTETCATGFGVPNSVHVLVGVAGGTLADVMTADTNTGIGNVQQCVFHVTIVPGQNGVPAQVTDIIVQNMGESALTGYNTITVSAEVA